MLPIEHREQRVGCCMKPVLSSSPAMNVDCALNELGMLSSVTQSRRQYLAEKDRRRSVARERFLSEPAEITDASTTYVPRSRPQISETPSPETPLNSPLKGSGFHILQLNMNYVTKFSTCSPKKDGEAFTMDTRDEPWQHLGKDYGSKDSHPRFSKSKGSSRLRRLKKPYEIPWRHSIESYYSDQSVLPSPSSSLFDNCITESKRSSKIGVSSSNSSTPEKTPSCSQRTSMSRSKSLDDLDLAKLKLAEEVEETGEMDRVSQHFNDLHVGE